MGAAATEFSGLKLGLELTGWVKNIMAYGVFVEFPHGLYGLAPKAVSHRPNCDPKSCVCVCVCVCMCVFSFSPHTQPGSFMYFLLSRCG